MLERPRIDWSKPVQWMDGTPCTAESFQGFKLVRLTDGRYPPECEELMARKHFKDSIVVHEDTGVPACSLADIAPNAWVVNVEQPAPRPWEEHVGQW